MTKTSKPLSDDDIEAYIDGLLEPRRNAEIEGLLASDPQKAEIVRAMRRQNEALRLLGDDVLDEPIPDRLRAVVDELKESQGVSRKIGSFMLAQPPRRLALLAAMVLGCLGSG